MRRYAHLRWRRRALALQAVITVLAVSWLAVAMFLLWLSAMNEKVPSPMVVVAVALFAALGVASLPWTLPLMLEAGERSLRQHRDRKRRGTRRVLDWQHSHRSYLLVAVLLFGGWVGGADLFTASPPWPRALGVLVLASNTALTLALIRWLRLPVDPESAERLRAEREEMRLLPRRRASP